MRRQVKASSAGSTEGSGNSRGLFRRAFATRGASSRFGGSGAPSSRSTLVFLAALVLAITVSLGAATAVADTPPVVTIGNSPTAEYTTAEVSGTVNPSGGPSTAYWHFEYTTTPADDSSWQFGPGGEIAGPDAEGTSPVPVGGKIEFLQPETKYSVRLVAENEEGANHVATGAPYPTFTTKGPVAKPTVSLDPVTTFDATTAQFSGTINPGASGTSDPGFAVEWHFQCMPECPNVDTGTGPNPIPADASDHAVSGEATGLEPNTAYEVTLVSKNAGDPVEATRVSFKTDAVAPTVETIPAFALEGGTEALLGARVNPKNSATSYRIEYGTTTAYGNSVTASAGSGGGDQILTQKVSGLAPSTEYHFLAVAESAEGKVRGKDMNFETAPEGPAPEPCENEDLRSENNSTQLPDCRAFEKVSPDDKNGYDAAAGLDFTAGEGAGGPPFLGNPSYFAAEQGSAIAYMSNGGYADSRAAATANFYLSRRGAGSWTTHGLTPPQVPRLNTAFPNFVAFSPSDLRFSLIKSPPNSRLAPGERPDKWNLYLGDNFTDTYYTLTLESPLGTPGSNPDTPPYVFTTPEALLPGLEENEENAYTYEWDDGHIELASIAPDGNPFPGGAALQGWAEVDGVRRIVLKETGVYPAQLFLRTVTATEANTVEISASERTTPEPNGNINYWGMSADGSRIFFSTATALTDDAPTGGSEKLYMYDAGAGKLINLTASALGQFGVVGISGISPDGEYVYFRGVGSFHAGENDSREAGFFVWHNGTVTQFGTPSGDFSTAETENRPNYTTSRVSPDGRYFSFSTAHQMVAYDNRDRVAKTDGGDPVRDFEVYVYDAVKDRLTCVSCNPIGERPNGPSATPSPPGETSPLQRVVLNDGRAFFVSRDALVPEDVNGVQDVYEWKQGRVHLLSSGVGSFATLGSVSNDGTDVYLATRAQLIPSDLDELGDIYDARVGGGFSQPLAPNLCEGVEGCHGPRSTAPALADPLSSTYTPGAKALTPQARRLRKALKACKRKPRRARARCRAAAKKRFIKASKGRAH